MEKPGCFHLSSLRLYVQLSVTSVCLAGKKPGLCIAQIDELPKNGPSASNQVKSFTDILRAVWYALLQCKAVAELGSMQSLCSCTAQDPGCKPHVCHAEAKQLNKQLQELQLGLSHPLREMYADKVNANAVQLWAMSKSAFPWMQILVLSMLVAIVCMPQRQWIQYEYETGMHCLAHVAVCTLLYLIAAAAWHGSQELGLTKSMLQVLRRTRHHVLADCDTDSLLAEGTTSRLLTSLTIRKS